MTKQKFPRGVQQERFEGDLCGTRTEQSWKRRADTQPAAPASGADHVPRAKECFDTKASGSLLPLPPYLVGGSQWI